MYSVHCKIIVSIYLFKFLCAVYPASFIYHFDKVGDNSYSGYRDFSEKFVIFVIDRDIRTVFFYISLNQFKYRYVPFCTVNSQCYKVKEKVFCSRKFNLFRFEYLVDIGGDLSLEYHIVYPQREYPT